MEFKVNSGIWGSMFGVPDVVADNFLKLATGGQIKVLLYILRNSGRVCSDEEISMNTGVTPQEAADAMLFWQNANVLSPQNISSVPSQSMFSVPAPNNETASPQPETQTIPNSAAPQSDPAAKSSGNIRRLMPTEVDEIMKGSSDITELFRAVEVKVGPLKHPMRELIIWMFDDLGMKKEVIFTLISYCQDNDKLNTHYLQKTALDWVDSGVDTFEKAQNEIERITMYNGFCGEIMKMFQMNRRPTTKQGEFVEQWRKKNYKSELIHFAYEITIEQINKLSFDYINKILLSWEQKGYTTLKQVREAEKDFRSKKKNNSKVPYNPDMEKYEVVINKF